VLRAMFLAKVLKLSALGVCAIGMAAAAVAWLPTAGADPTTGGKDAPKGSPPTREAPKAGSDLERIQGTWVVESANGPAAAKAAGAGFPAGWEIVKGKFMTFSGDRVEFAHLPGRLRTFRLGPTHDPKRLDFAFRDLVGLGGRMVPRDADRPCIYKFDGDRLRIVMGDPDLQERPDSFEWAGPRSPFVYLDLRRPTADERETQERNEGNALEGTWDGLLVTVKGHERAAPAGLQLVVKGDRLRFDLPESGPLHATFTVDLATIPWHIDLTATAGSGGLEKGAKVAGIFARHGNFLTLSLGGSAGRPTSFEAAAKEGTVYVLYRDRISTREALELWRPGATPPPPETPKKAGPPANDRIRQLQRERVKALEAQLQGSFERVKIGKEPLVELLSAVRELGEAELEVAETPKDRITAAEAMLKRFMDIEKQLFELQQAGLQTKQGIAQATAARLKAEIELEKLKMGR
jgi:uncharacterized protein (TIGR03067 family)